LKNLYLHFPVSSGFCKDYCAASKFGSFWATACGVAIVFFLVVATKFGSFWATACGVAIVFFLVVATA